MTNQIHDPGISVKNYTSVVSTPSTYLHSDVFQHNKLLAMKPHFPKY